MKKNLTLLLAFVFMALTQVNAQQTGDEIFVLDLKIDGVVTNTFKNGPCGFSAPTDWGGAITGDFCIPVVWGYDISPDSLGCDTITNNYSGKAVMIRRGVCEFGAKAFFAQSAGASMAIIANGYASNHGDACNAPGMAAGTKGALVTIPTVLICRNAVDAIDAALKLGKTPEICVRRLSLHDPSAEYAYATPLSQLDTVELITLQAVNRTGVAQDFTAKVEITDPAGTVTTLESTQFIEPGGDSIFYFNSYVPTPQVGTFKLRYTVDLATSPGDTLYRNFVITEHTFATDNFQINGGAFNDASFVAGGNIYRAASLYKTGDAGMTAQYATFAINNAATVAVANENANQVNVILRDADPNDDGVNDIGTDKLGLEDLTFIAYNDVTFSATTGVDSLITVELQPVDGDKVLLKPNHLYYLVLVYDGNAAALGKQLSLSVTPQVEYLSFTNTGLITPITLDNLYSGWGGATVISRLQEEGFGVSGVTTPLLSKLKYNVSPNPTSDFVNLNLDLAAQNKSVVVSLIDAEGRTVATQKLKDFQNGQVKFNARNLASGFYAISVRTSEEGNAVSSLMICH